MSGRIIGVWFLAAWVVITTTTPTRAEELNLASSPDLLALEIRDTEEGGARVLLRPRSCSELLEEPEAPALVDGLLDVPESAATAIRQELVRIVTEAIPEGSESPLLGWQYNRMLEALHNFAQSRGIEISRGPEALGVYPKGLREIQLSGFHFAKDDQKAVTMPMRHELGHVFHMLQLRALILSALPSQPSTKELEEAEKKLKALENGMNYLEFEKVVGSLSSTGHFFRRKSQESGLYRSRLIALLHGVELGLQAGKMRFPGGRSFEQVYALALSRLPIIVGTSGKGLLFRIPMIILAYLYLGNVDLSMYGIQAAEMMGLGSDAGMRDIIHFWLFNRRH